MIALRVCDTARSADRAHCCQASRTLRRKLSELFPVNYTTLSTMVPVPRAGSLVVAAQNAKDFAVSIVTPSRARILFSGFFEAGARVWNCRC